MDKTTRKTSTQTHKVNVTVSDPHHTAASKRSEKILKRVIVNATDKGDALAKAQSFYKKKGYKVHDVEHHSVYPATAMKTEDVAANAVGGGNVAGIGVGPQGEPPKSKALLKRVKTMLKRKVPNVGSKLPT